MNTFEVKAFVEKLRVASNAPILVVDLPNLQSLLREAADVIDDLSNSADAKLKPRPKRPLDAVGVQMKPGERGKVEVAE